MHPPQAILWDWDNTLADNWGALTAAINAVFARYGMPPWTVADSRQRMRHAIRDSFPPMFGASWEQARDVFLATLEAVQLDHLAAMPDVAEALAAAARWPQAVVSNKPGAALRREVGHIGWNAYFRAVIGAGDAEADKPHPAPIWQALAAIGLKPGPEIWYVGDTGVDMLAARAAGVTAVLLGDAAHDGGVAALEQREAAPHLHCLTASALTARFRAFAPDMAATRVTPTGLTPTGLTPTGLARG